MMGRKRFSRKGWKLEGLFERDSPMPFLRLSTLPLRELPLRKKDAGKQESTIELHSRTNFGGIRYYVETNYKMNYFNYMTTAGLGLITCDTS